MFLEQQYHLQASITTTLRPYRLPRSIFRHYRCHHRATTPRCLHLCHQLRVKTLLASPSSLGICHRSALISSRRFLMKARKATIVNWPWMLWHRHHHKSLPACILLHLIGVMVIYLDQCQAQSLMLWRAI